MLLTGGWAGGEAALWELRDEIKVRWHRCSRFAPIHLIPVGTICPLACTCALFITLQRTLTDCVLVVQSKDDDSSEASTGPATKLLDGKDVMYTGKVMIFCAAVSVLQFQCCSFSAAFWSVWLRCATRVRQVYWAYSLGIQVPAQYCNL